MEKPKTLIDFLKAVVVISDEPTFNISEAGIQTRVMDPSRVAMVDFELPAQTFTSFKCEPGKLTFNLPEALKLLRRARQKEQVEISANEKLTISITDASGIFTRRKFTMQFLEPQEAEMPVPKVTFKAKAKLLPELLQAMFEDAQLVSDHVSVTVTQDQLSMKATGDLLNADLGLEKGHEGLFELEAQEPTKATFSLSYLASIMKAAADTSQLVTMELAKDMPMKVTFQIEAGKLEYYLAPRIEVD